MSKHNDPVTSGTTANTTGIASFSMGESLTIAQLKTAMDSIYQSTPKPRGLFADLRADRSGRPLPRNDLGHRLTVSTPYGSVRILSNPYVPAEQAKIQVRQIRLKDGTPLLRESFIDSENSQWRELCGTKPVAFMFDDMVVMNPKVQAMFQQMSKRIDDDFVKTLLGGT